MKAVHRLLCGGTCAILGAAAVGSTTVVAQPTQPVFLQYDGYVRARDGGYILAFGYFNMNNVDVPIAPGEANGFMPPPADRNQPIMFLKGRHRFACVMVVDKNFAGGLRWTVAFAG